MKSIEVLRKIATEKGLTSRNIISAREKYGAWEKVGEHIVKKGIRKEDIRDIASKIYNIDTSERIKGWYTPVTEKIEKLREVPLIRRAFRPIKVDYIRTYTKSGKGEHLYHLIVKGAYRNEKTGEVKVEEHSSHLSTEKDFNAHYEDAVTRPGSQPETNWVLITDENDPEYIKITMRWRMYGGKKGVSPFLKK
jgi:hypothetical protein